MDENIALFWAQVLVALISVAGVIFGSVYSAKVQEEKDKKAREDREAVAVAALKTERRQLQSELETKAQEFINETFDDMRTKIKEQDERIQELESSDKEKDATIKHQGAEIMRLRDRVKVIETDRDHWKERALKAESGTGGRRV